MSLEPGRLLDVHGMEVCVGDLPLVHDVDLAIEPGERVGLIGESGSGKSLTALSIMGLLPEGLHASGSVQLAGVDRNLLQTSEQALAEVRGHDMAMVFQEPMSALNPTMRVGKQVAEAMLIHHTRPDRRTARRAAVEMLHHMQLPDPEAAARAYPHQLSGGQQQRVVAALALANDPRLLVCDEPTTALDVTVQAVVLDQIVRGVRARQAALLFITHDLAVVATTCERVLVMYGGRIVEAGTVQDVFTRPRHRYTQGLLASSDLEHSDTRHRLVTIPGQVPAAGQFPDGCVFRNRCAWATEVCTTVPPWTGDDTRDGFACYHPAGADDEEP